jgi:hypothetical protein
LRHRLFAAERNDAADVRLLDVGGQLIEDVGVAAGIDAGKARHDELADELIGRQRFERDVDPPLRVAIERRFRWLRGWQRCRQERDDERGTSHGRHCK